MVTGPMESFFADFHCNGKKTQKPLGRLRKHPRAVPFALVWSQP